MLHFTNFLFGLKKAQHPYVFNKKTPLIIALLLVCSFMRLTHAQAPIRKWDKRFGGNGMDYLSKVIATQDGGYLLSGTSNSAKGEDKSADNKGAQDFWIVKLDSVGNKLWDKTFGGTDEDGLSAALETLDGGFLLAGHSSSGMGGDKTTNEIGGWVVKTDQQGNKLWDKTFSSSTLGGGSLGSIIQTSDGNYLLAGTSASQDYWILKIDGNGTKLWEKTIGGDGMDIFSAVIQTSDGSYLLGGSSWSGIGNDKTQDSRGMEDYWIVKVDKEGNKLWDKRFGGPATDQLASMIETSEGNYLLGGTSFSDLGGDKSEPNKSTEISGEFPPDYWVVKTDGDGNKLWDKSFGSDAHEGISTIMEAPDSNYILAGSSNAEISGDKSEVSRGGGDYWLLTISSNGTKLWDKRFGGNEADGLTSIIQTLDGNYLLAGYSNSDISGDKTEDNQSTYSAESHSFPFDYWIVKTQPVASPVGPYYTMSDTVITACNGIFYNPGIVETDSAEYIQTFFPATPGAKLRFVFTSFQPSTNGFQYIYDGESVNAPLIGVYSGFTRFSFPPDTIVASNPTGALTFRFIADNGKISFNWAASIACVANPLSPSVPIAQWDKRFGGSQAEVLSSVIETEDGGYLLAGSSLSGLEGDKSEENKGEWDYWLIKTDTAGNTLWDRTYGSPNHSEVLTSAIPTNDGGYLLAGSSYNASAYSSSLWVVKISGKGGKQWDKRYPTNSQQSHTSLIETSDGGYLLAGTVNGVGDELEEYLVIKLNNSGNKQWQKSYGGSENDKLASVIETKDGAYILAGTSRSGISGDRTEENESLDDYWMIKIDTAGTKLWDKSYGGNNYSHLASMIKTRDGGYLLAGESYADIGGEKTENSRGYTDYWIVKIDEEGNKQWDKTFGSRDYDVLTSVIQTSDGGYLLGGHTMSGLGGDKSGESRGSYDYWIVKVDELGTKQWDKSFGGHHIDRLTSMIQTKQGGYLLAGLSLSGIGGNKTQASRGGYDYWIIKTTPEQIALPIALHINFQDKHTKTPVGWLKDYGLPFGEKIYANTTCSFGWKRSSDGSPIDLSVGGPFPGNGRWRPAPTDVLLATLMHMQGNHVQNFRGNPTEAYWELAVENGDYQVSVSVGDGTKYTGTNLESHSIRVEEIAAITHFVPQGSPGSMTRFKQATMKVTVSDGYLTIDADEGTNTKINYAIIQPLNTASLAFVRKSGFEQGLVQKPMRAYPNPFSNILRIETLLGGKVKILLVDMLGNSYYEAFYQVKTGQIVLDLSAVPMKTGMYLIRLQAEDGESQVSRIIKSK